MLRRGRRTIPLRRRAQRARNRSPVRSEHPVQGLRELGVVDLGSNTARLSIYRSAPVGPPWIVHESKEVPRLGEGVDDHGRLTVPAQREAVETLRRFERILDERGIRARRAVATSAVRDAPNRSDFLRRVRTRTDLPLRIISGEEEAQYAYLGVASSLPLDNDLVMDLGGGSAQLLRVERGRLAESTSLPIGSLRLYRRFLRHDPPKRSDLDDLNRHIDKLLDATTVLRPAKGWRVVGVGGTARGIAHVLQGMGEYPFEQVHGFTIDRERIEELGDELEEMPVEARRALPGMSSDRADIIVAGVSVVRRLLRRVRADSFTVSGCGIREGIATAMVGRPVPLGPDAMAAASAHAASWAFGLSFEHGPRVQAIARVLVDLLGGLHALGHEEERALEVAALLHDAGTIVAYPHHAEHSSYLIQNHAIYGLSHRGLLLAALTVGGHEGEDVPGKIIRRYRPVLQESDPERIRSMSAMLHLAEALAEGRSVPRFRRRGSRLTVYMPTNARPSPRAFEKASRAVRRALGLEVEYGS